MFRIQGFSRIKKLTNQHLSYCVSTYNPKAIETTEKYEKWQKQLKLTNLESKSENFVMLFPPPNITGALHLGHSLTVAVQDALVRWNQLKNKNTYWIPGFDHASIATQTLIEKKLKKESLLTRYDVGRDGLLELINDWKTEQCSKIRNQLKSMGALMNWDREYFTLDKQQSDAVRKAFIRLFDEGLIYRAEKVVNWSCALQSTISDIEIDYLEIQGRTNVKVPGYDREIEFGVLTEFAYKLEDGDEITVATTRPETISGDVALAVHPEDLRYTKYHGKKVWNPFRKQLIPIVCDADVDRKFGTGVLKVTPAHSLEDYKIAKRHSLRIEENTIDERGLMPNPHNKKDLVKRFDGRRLVVEYLKAEGLWRAEKDHCMKVPMCSRSGDVIEYLLKPQWFLNCKKMAAEAIESVQSGRLVIDPAIGFESNWCDWLQKSPEWCISRQLWWGHEIPVYYDRMGKTVAAESYIEAQRKMGTDDYLRMDNDVLDTWFSAALLPFSISGWPSASTSKMYQDYFPLSLMETGHDILLFWVSKMVMLSLKLTGCLPFPKVLLHGIICDASGRKMSKSLGNVLLPDDIINGATLNELNKRVDQSFTSGLIDKKEMEKAQQNQQKMFPDGIPECGSDALRFTLCSHNIKSILLWFPNKKS